MDTTRILFLDIDNTLLNRKKEITPEVNEAIRSVLANGHRIVIASGRSLPGVIGIAKQLRLDRPGCYCISGNGAEIWDFETGTALLKQCVSVGEASYIFRLAEAEGLHIQTYDSRDVLSREMNEELAFYIRSLHISYRIDPGLPDTLTEDPIKLLAIDLHNRSKLDRLRAEIEKWSCGRLSCFYSNDWYLEIVRAGVSKGSAVRFLAKHLDVPIEQTVSAGDSENDIPMIEAAGVGCAMQNASPEVKAAADYITERDCDHSGLTEIIDKFILHPQQAFHR